MVCHEVARGEGHCLAQTTFHLKVKTNSKAVWLCIEDLKSNQMHIYKYNLAVCGKKLNVWGKYYIRLSV